MADLLGDDPAADFLQQEQDELRELGIDDSQFNEQHSMLNGENGNDPYEFVNNEIPQQGVITNEFESIDTPPAVPTISMMPVEEPEAVMNWRKEKAENLLKQQQEENEAALLWKEKAKKELEDWYTRYNEQLEKVSAENKVAESEFIEEMTDQKPGNEWEKAARLCDFNPKFSKNTKDVSRMRGLLLKLKQDPLVR